MQGANFNLCFYEYNQEELKFFDLTYKIFEENPLKFLEVWKKIFQNAKISFFLDSTILIKIVNLEFLQIRMLFFVLKQYLKENLIRIIYKKEYIIIHTKSKKEVEIWSYSNLFLALLIYQRCKELRLKVYFRAVLEENANKELIDLVLFNNNSVYLINTTKRVEIKTSHLIKVFAYIYKPKINLSDHFVLKFYHNKEFFAKNLKEIFD